MYSNTIESSVLDLISHFSNQIKHLEILGSRCINTVLDYIFSPINQSNALWNTPLLETIALHYCSLDALKLAAGIEKRYGRTRKDHEPKPNQFYVKIKRCTMKKEAFDIMSECLPTSALEWDGEAGEDYSGDTELQGSEMSGYLDEGHGQFPGAFPL